ncbi:MAG: hypothetical protein JNL38_22985 [Myxococcales bacterium]|nr:hypothetical protein [Myxococcales bacterium]
MTAEALAELATEVAHALGLRDAGGASLSFDAQRERDPARVRARLLEALHGCRPAKRAPAVGAVVKALLDAAAARSAPSALLRHVAELRELVAQGGHRRTKRAERDRAFGALLVVFGLDAALGFTADPRDPLKLTRAVEAWIQSGR